MSSNNNAPETQLSSPRQSPLKPHSPEEISGNGKQENKAPSKLSAIIEVLGFPGFILAGSALAFFFPAPFTPLTDYITYFLMIIMFAMGLTLTIPDFKQVAKRPLAILVGVIAQFVIMPLLAIAVAKVLGLNPALAVGLLMLGSVPGGTSSNVIAYLARGDVALSVAMTSVSTLVSPIMTPFLMLVLADAHTEVDGLGMAWSLCQTVLLPVVGGLIIRFVADSFINKILPILPWISILGIGGVVFGAVAKNAESLAHIGLIVFVAVIIHNVLGYVLGFFAGQLVGMPTAGKRTVAVEVGTQSEGLSSGMAAKFFTPEAALPGAVAAVVHNITGAIYVTICRKLDEGKESSKSASV
ncbi:MULTISPECIES: bile acid:sodium symporter family protein [Corynebacterium]|uniref:Bile acid:sodium symporter family protein n=1 Tax=Corynebacterium amycolatum TaxID=43765 RepID=A0AB38XSL5_CORAY|nr:MULTISPECIES: bile acid:sodium symporter family protein [Corynebacterium]AIN83254.1 sodium Bile acid symporter family protein [Corynebacterium sp. ATCC 6931]MBC6726628.1 Na+-dependent transporter [Corynebacterium amycolatum]MDY7341642.1 bile acid:sodium symporter family protein [Corynebacterium amycolatum]WET42967.1 bile acid:sodium symporter family protein [Corynebacterium amycolatum]